MKNKIIKGICLFVLSIFTTFMLIYFDYNNIKTNIMIEKSKDK